MQLTMRSWRGDDDYWHLRDLLRRAMVANGRRERSWHVARLDYWWWFVNPDLERLDPRERMTVWTTRDGSLAAAVTLEQVGEAFLVADPSILAPSLVEAMAVAAEERVAAVDAGGGSRLRIVLDRGDLAAAVLARRGYLHLPDGAGVETQHRRELRRALPRVPAIPGYEIRPMRDGLEMLERCYASGLAFHGDDVAVARANRDDPAWYRHIQAAPLYRRDLDIVAVAADGSVAAFCTAWFDDVTRTGYLEPIATVAAHRRRGLARAVMLEALHRLRRMGCLVAFVGGYSTEANALYAAVMGPDHDVAEPWELVRPLGG